jgi:iron complex outermembrane receptor protein
MPIASRSAPPLRRLAAAGVLTPLLLAGVPAALGAQAATTGSVTGRVTGADGEALQGATVAVTGTQFGAITRADGTYRLALRPGRYELRVRLLGYTGASDSVTVTAGGTVRADFRVPRAPSQLQAVTTTGTRAESRTVVDAPSPIDVLTSVELRASGRTETAQIIQMLAPSFNFPRPSVTDGTDHVRPASLRGLGPDQVLVLVNGKRRYTSALVNVNGSIGRGTAAGRTSTPIPASMIDRIEVCATARRRSTAPTRSPA